MNALANLTPKDLSAMTTGQLKKRLAEGLQMTADGLRVMSAIWNELRGRGEDMNDLRMGLARYLPMIAAGALAPEAVVAFASRPFLVLRLAGLPLPEQIRMAEGGCVEVFDPHGGSKSTPLAALSSYEIRLIFPGGGEIAPVEQQREDAELAPQRKKRKDSRAEKSLAQQASHELSYFITKYRDLEGTEAVVAAARAFCKKHPA